MPASPSPHSITHVPLGQTKKIAVCGALSGLILVSRCRALHKSINLLVRGQPSHLRSGCLTSSYISEAPVNIGGIL